MAILHSTLTDAELHELKGASTATLGQVPISDGVGKSSWGSPPGSPSNEITVTTVDDFPEAVANVIVLADNTLYRLSTIVNIGLNRIVFGNNSLLVGGSSNIDGISSSTTGTLLTATNVNMIVEKLQLLAPTGNLINYTGSITTAIKLNNVVSASFINIGTLDSAGNGIIDECSFIGGVNGLNFTGSVTNGNFAIITCRFVAFSGIALDLGTAILDTLIINTVYLNGLPGSTSLKGAPASANILTKAKVLHCTFNGAGVPIVGITPFDLKYNFMDNDGVPSTHVVGQGVAKNNALPTVFAGTSTDGSTAVKVNVGTTFIPDIQHRITISNTGTFTYTGIEDISVYVDVTIFGEITGGSSRQYNFYIAKNGVPIVSTASKREYTGSNPGANSCSGLIEVVTNDTIELRVEAITATTNLTIDTFSLKVIGE